MRPTYQLYKATPLQLMFQTIDHEAVGRHKGCDIIPTTKTILEELNIPRNIIDELLLKQKKSFQVSTDQLELLQELRPYQIEDALFLAARKSAGCFNEQRTGKTPTCLKAFKLKGLTKILIVCPGSAAPQWQDEYEKWYQEPCLIIDGKQKNKVKTIANWTHGIVLSYDSLKIKDYYDKETGEYSHSRGDLAEILKHKDIEGVIVDEVHRIRNRKTKTAEAIFRLSHIENKLALSGTPTIKEQLDIYSTLRFLYPRIFTSYWKFADYYFHKDVDKYWKAGRMHETPIHTTLKREKELQEFLAVISTSRKRKEVMPWLPDKESITIRLEPTKEQKAYLKELKEFFETEHIVTQGVLDRLIRERQICLAPALLALDGASPKIEWIKQYIKDYPDKSIIIFSKFTQWLKFLAKELNTDALFIGGIGKTRQNQLKKDFQAGKVKVLLIQIDAGKEALTLDKGEVIIFTDKYPPAGDIQQAEDRFVATTEDKADKDHTIYTLVLKGTYEEQLDKNINEGCDEIEVINNYKKYLKEKKR